MIQVSHLTKKYGQNTAVDDISFEVQQGEIVGYLGPNGAGKSTTLKMLVGLLQPTSGEISVAGYNAETELLELKRHIGYVPEEAQLYEHLTLVEHLQLMGRLYQLEEGLIAQKIKELAKLFDMESQASQRISSFSQGMRQKCLIMSALMHNPDVLFLDEPFTNLDVGTVTLMKALLQRLADLGKTILYCTHILEVAETLCPRIMIINAGKLIADAPVEELRQETNQTALNEIFAQLTETTGIDEKTEEAIRIVTGGTQMFEKIAVMFGASPTQYRYLLETEKIVEKRALEQKGDFRNLTLVVTCVLCFAISAFFTSMPFFLPMDTFTYALTGITVSMMMIGLWTIPYFDILLSPINYPVIAHTPVSSRTYFLVKLTQVATYTVWLLASLNLMPAIGGIWIRGEESSPFQFLFPLVYLPIVFMSGLFTIGVMTVFAGYLTKLYTRQALRNIAQYAQFIFPALFPAVLVTLPHLLPSLPKDKLTSVLKWFYALPNGWFAATVSLVLGQIERHFLILAGLAVASTLFLVLVPLRSIAKSYSEYLSYLLESGNKQRSKLRVKTPLFARMFRNQTIRAGLCLSYTYLRRDKHILRQFFASLGTVIMLIVLFARDSSSYMTWPHNPNAIGLSPGFSGTFYFAGISAITGFIAPVKCSEHWKASWMLTLTPVPVPKDLWRGVQATTLFYILVPCTLLMFCIATIFWGILGIFHILPGLTIFTLLCHSLPKTGIWFASRPKSSSTNKWLVTVASI